MPSAGVFVFLSGVHAAGLVVAMSIPVVAIGLWWNANTIAHNFIHRPFFRARTLNASYAVFLSLLLGVPQSVWRERHLYHHAGRAWRLRITAQVIVELFAIAALWTTMGVLVPSLFVAVYLPGWVIGLGLCQLQGHFEHAGGTTSHYGRIYNFFFFNDGYHVEHHLKPGADWSDLRQRREPAARQSRWPPVLRWLDAFSLEGLERVVVRSPRLQRFVVAKHERAFRRLLPQLTEVRRVAIVGGGLFPRTYLVLRRLLPDAEITVIDANAEHLAMARRFLDGDAVQLVHRRFRFDEPLTADLVVMPLSFDGDRRVAYDRPPGRAVLIHDWVWSARRPGVVISWLLLKRLNLVTA